MKTNVEPDHVNLLGLAEALTILAKYEPDGSYDFQHDQMWAGPQEVSPADAERLEKLGWFLSEGGWSCFS